MIFFIINKLIKNSINNKKTGKIDIKVKFINIFF